MLASVHLVDKLKTELVVFGREYFLTIKRSAMSKGQKLFNLQNTSNLLTIIEK